MKPILIAAVAALVIFFAGWMAREWKLDSDNKDIQIAAEKAAKEQQKRIAELERTYENQINTLHADKQRLDEQLLAYKNKLKGRRDSGAGPAGASDSTKEADHRERVVDFAARCAIDNDENLIKLAGWLEYYNKVVKPYTTEAK